MIDAIVDFFKDHAFNIALIIAVVLLIKKFTMLFISKLIKKALRPDQFKSKIDEQKREDTLIGIASSVINFVVLIIAILLLLAEVGVNIGPLLAGAGIFGVAIGFGSQSLVKDMVSGLFILSENQYRIGDVVRFNDEISGTVEHIGLRTTILRDIEGNVHHIPNGYIEYATNMTMEFAKINMEINVAYDTDIKKLEKVINEVGVELANDDEWKDKIIEAPKFLRINEFAESALVVKIMGKTEATQQWGVAGELRKRLKESFDKAGIVIPLPQRVIHSSKTK